jgi:hypothetical protein
MATVNVDWDSMESNSFELLEIGDYSGTIEKVELKGPGASGFKYLEFTIALADYPNRKMWNIYSFSPKALWKMKEELEAFGVAGVDTGVFDTEEFVGREVIITLGTQDKYNGKPDENGDMPQENNVEALVPGGF